MRLENILTEPTISPDDSLLVQTDFISATQLCLISENRAENVFLRKDTAALSPYTTSFAGSTSIQTGILLAHPV